MRKSINSLVNMATWEIVDSETTELIDFDLTWLPPAAYQYVTPRIRRVGASSRIFLEATSFVGTLPLLNGDTLLITPRAGQKSFARMLFVSDGLEDALPEGFSDFAALAFDESGRSSWLSLLARSYMQKLRTIEKNSLTFDRKKITEDLPYARGRVHVVPTLRNLVLAKEHPVRCTYRVREYPNAENRILASAVGILQNHGLILPTDRYSATFWLEFLRERHATETELRNVISGLQSYRYTGPRSYYVPALLMARLIISEGGISLSSTTQVETEPVLTNMPLLFERYVRAIIARGLQERGYLVEKPAENLPTLFMDGTCQLTPDILISQASRVSLVADAKYKITESISSADYYQLYAYMSVYGTKKGLLLLPTTHSDAPSLVHRETVNGLVVWEMRLPLDDWESSEAFVIQSLHTLLTS